MARNVALIVSGVAGALATSTTVCLHVTAGVSIPTPALRGMCALSAFFEAVVLFILTWLAVARMPWHGPSLLSRSRLTVCLGLEVLLCTLATGASVVALIYLGHYASVQARRRLLAATSVAVALATVLQLAFFTMHCVAVRQAAPSSLGADSEAVPNAKSPGSRQTTPSCHESREMESLSRKDSTPSTMTKSMTGTTIKSLTASCPSSSRTRLLSIKDEDQLRPACVPARVSASAPAPVDSMPDRSSGNDSLESWDTSSVDNHNRQVVLASSPPMKSRLLETIPASPTTSRSPSPGTTAVELEPPPCLASAGRPGRSTSASRQRDEPPSANESHIHPLFRSDSPTPPPVALPGTSVVASPNAGQVITRRESVQSLRSRSSVLAGKSPLGRQNSIQGSLLSQQSRPEDKKPLTEHLLASPLQPPVPHFSIRKG